MGDQGLRSTGGNPASSPYSNGPYTWDQHLSFSAGVGLGNTNGNIRYVDGVNGSDSNDGKAWGRAFLTIQAGVTAAGKNGIVFVAPLAWGAGETDPDSYTENVVIPLASSNLAIIGVGGGRTQGGLPQLKVGDTTTSPLLDIQAPGCLIMNMGINGYGGTGGGVLLTDDAGATSTAFGTTIIGCHFKNCVGTSATNAATGGAIQWGTDGGAWQVLIKGNRFYKNVGDIVLLRTDISVPQDVVIEDNVFSGPAANTDCNLYLQNGSGMNGVIIRNNEFTANPNIGSGTNADFLRLTGCVGMLVGNRFAADLAITFGAEGDNTVPTTVFMAGNYGEEGASNDTGYIFRT